MTHEAQCGPPMNSLPLMTRLAQVFADERGKLEHEWDKGENVSTEDLRVALRRYGSFFDRLLSV
jgi:hypothetical protein